MVQYLTLWLGGVTALLLLYLHCTSGSLIASSEVQMCARSSASFEPMLGTGKPCTKKFVVSLAVRNGQGESGAIYANIKFVENRTGLSQRREQLAKPFRISVTKSDVHIVYPLRYLNVINNQITEHSHMHTNAILGINSCKPVKECRGRAGYCCASSMDEKLSRAWEYKRGHGRKEGHYFSHKYSIAVCMVWDHIWYRVCEIRTPFLVYTVNVTVQQLDFKSKGGNGEEGEDVWKTVGYVEIGPRRIGDNTARNHKGKSSGPQIVAEWQGDFATNAYFTNFGTKYLLVPDWRLATLLGRGQEFIERAKKHPQVLSGPDEWLIVDKHMVDISSGRRKCNKLGTNSIGFVTQPNKCRQETGSCFRVSVKSVYDTAKRLKNANLPTHYFPTFYGEFKGPHRQIRNSTLPLSLAYRSSQTHTSLVTLTFTADSISFVENRSPGRIVEALVEDFMALVGSGMLTVTVQNTGHTTADYSVSIGQCTEGIIQVSEKTKTLNPRQQDTFVFEISASLNMDFQHNCTTVLTNSDGTVLDMKIVSFSTMEGCVYCPAGQCDCDCAPEALKGQTSNLLCSSANNTGYLNPFWEPAVVVVGPCYHCWFTDSFKNPYTATFSVVVLLVCLGMFKMLCMHSCCRTKDGRYIDVAGVILGTTSKEHTQKKQRSATIQFLFGVCFFVYLPLLPLMIIVCSWRRQFKAKKRLKKKAQKKRQRLMAKKQAALLAMKGMMVQDGLTMDDALKLMEEGEKTPNRPAPKLPPKLLVVSSSSSDTDKHDFNYDTSSESLENFLAASKKRKPAPVPGMVTAKDSNTGVREEKRVRGRLRASAKTRKARARRTTCTEKLRTKGKVKATKNSKARGRKGKRKRPGACGGGWNEGDSSSTEDEEVEEEEEEDEEEDEEEEEEEEEEEDYSDGGDYEDEDYGGDD